MSRFTKSIIVLFCLVGNFCQAQDAKLDWVKTLWGYSTGYGHTIKLDKSGNIYTMGNFAFDTDFDPGPKQKVLKARGDYQDIFISKLDANGNFLWAKRIGGWYEENGLSMDLDPQGNILICGFFQDSVDFDPDSSVHNLYSWGGHDAFILKLDNEGKFLWVGAITGPNWDLAYCIKTDYLGNIFVSGEYKVNGYIEIGSYSYKLSNEGQKKGYLLKLAPDGKIDWVIESVGNKDQTGNTLGVDKTGNVWWAGRFDGNVDMDPGLAQFKLYSQGFSDVFIGKYSPSGKFIWAGTIGGLGEDFVSSIEIDSKNDVLLAGSFKQNIDLNPGISIKEFNSKGDFDFYMIKTDSAGNFLWGKTVGSDSTDILNSITLDKDDNIYATGSYFGKVDFNPGQTAQNAVSKGESDIFICKLNSNGQTNWVKSMGSEYKDFGYSIIVDMEKQIFTTGGFEYLCDFDPDSGQTNKMSFGAYDVFIHKLHPFTSQIATIYRGNSNSIYIDNSQNALIVNIENAKKSQAVVKVFNTQGAIIFEQKISERNEQITLPEISAGVYLVQLIQDFQTVSNYKVFKK